jgi:hypothetical protein
MEDRPDNLTDARSDLPDELDVLIKRHVNEQLGPYLGRAADKLRLAPGSLDTPGVARRTEVRPLVWRLARPAIAAGLLLGVGIVSSLIVRHFSTPSHKVAAPISASTRAPFTEPFTESVTTTWTHTYDAGTVLVDPSTPAQLYRRVEYQQIDWQDETGQWKSKVIVPREDLILIDVAKQ